MWGEAFYEKRLQIPHNRSRVLTPTSKEMKAIPKTLERPLKDFLEAKFEFALDYFAVEG